MREGWWETTLGEVVEIIIGRTPPRNDVRFWTTNLDRPFCTIADMTGQQVLPRREGVTESAEKAGRARRVPEGALLMSFKLTLGRVGFAQVDLFPNEAIAWLRPKRPDVADRYLALALSTMDLQDHAGRAVKGRTLNRSSLKAIPILLPPLDEQRRIVDLIAAIDEAIEGSELYLSRVDEMLSAAAAEHLDGPCPKMPLGAAADVVIGRQRSPKHATGDHIVKYLRAANVKDGQVLLHDVLMMNFTPAEQSTYALQPGDVLVSEGCGSLAQLGASARWHGDVGFPVCFQNTLLRLRAKRGVTIPGYLEHLARHAFRSGWWAGIASGTNIFHIGLERARRLPVPVPSLDEQESITELLNALGELAARSRTERARLIELRGALLSQLVSGDHEIPASYDEVMA